MWMIAGNACFEHPLNLLLVGIVVRLSVAIIAAYLITCSNLAYDQNQSCSPEFGCDDATKIPPAQGRYADPSIGEPK